MRWVLEPQHERRHVGDRQDDRRDEFHVDRAVDAHAHHEHRGEDDHGGPHHHFDVAAHGRPSGERRGRALVVPGGGEPAL